ncbi:hypothetical protein EV182_001218 [Spiromyces aspiralis]|uniref:Uncharacterized protein n=1 Tax=Spiromyces aspiralis TaxID=68401 RepID=A0ACC1HUZ5_9FUNG|nr:hypothetical protein EV182_001218 [Spiromyces aspiralis]
MSYLVQYDPEIYTQVQCPSCRRLFANADQMDWHSRRAHGMRALPARSSTTESRCPSLSAISSTSSSSTLTGQPAHAFRVPSTPIDRSLCSLPSSQGQSRRSLKSLAIKLGSSVLGSIRSSKTARTGGRAVAGHGNYIDAKYWVTPDNEIFVMDISSLRPTCQA